MTLPKFHQVEVKVGVSDPRGYTSHDIERGQKNQLMSGDTSDGTALERGPIRSDVLRNPHFAVASAAKVDLRGDKKTKHVVVTA